MMSEDRIRRFLDVCNYVANACPCDCLARGNPQHGMSCVLGGATLNGVVDALRLVLGKDYREDGSLIAFLNDERLQKEVSLWVKAGRPGGK